MKIIFSLYPEIMLVYLLSNYLLYSSNKYLNLFNIELLILLLVTVLKYVLRKQTYIKLPKIFYRPDKSFGCNTNIQEYNKGEIGMPSIHSIISIFLAIGFYKLKNIPLVIYSLIVPFTRLGYKYIPKIISCCESGCHTLLQVFISSIIGLILGKVLIK